MDEYIKKEEKTYIIHADSNIDHNSENLKKQDLPISNNNDANNYEPPKKIEVITDNGKNLNISDVSEYIEVEKPKEEKKENIIIPKEKK